MRGIPFVMMAWMASPAFGVMRVSNGYYTAHVQRQADGYRIGSWNAVTGANHSAGPNQSLLYRGTRTTTNYSTLRVYDTTPRDYSMGGLGGAISLDGSVVSDSPSSPNGYETKWSLTTEALEITQDVQVVGQGAAAAVYHSVLIENVGSDPKSIGWRNLHDWDLMNDRPSNAIEACVNGAHAQIVPTTTNHFDYQPSGGEYVRVETVACGGASFEVLLSLGPDPAVLPSYPVTTPTRYTFANWYSAFTTAFDFSAPLGTPTGDSAGLSWFGHDAASALRLAPGQSTRITQVLVAVPAGACFPASVPEPSSACIGLMAFCSLLAGRFRTGRV